MSVSVETSWDNLDQILLGASAVHQSQVNWRRDSRVLAKLGFMFVQPTAPLLCSFTFLYIITDKLAWRSTLSRLHTYFGDLNIFRLATLQPLH